MTCSEAENLLLEQIEAGERLRAWRPDPGLTGEDLHQAHLDFESQYDSWHDRAKVILGRVFADPSAALLAYF